MKVTCFVKKAPVSSNRYSPSNAEVYALPNVTQRIYIFLLRHVCTEWV